VFAAVEQLDPWRFQAHPEVWLVVLFLIGSYIYMVRSIGPHAVAEGEPVVTRRQVGSFAGAMALLWIGADWPVHDIGEEYLYSAHMVQHMIFTLFFPPLALLATPEWMLRLIIGDGRFYRACTWLAKPLAVGIIFNLMVMITHIPMVVNASTENGLLHYSLHFLLVTTALMMWMPVLGPFPEWQIGAGAKCIYLFLMSVVSMVPAGWLTFAEGSVYDHYEQPVRVWGISVTDDQQLAGAIMKVAGSMYLWVFIVYYFFKRFGKGFEEENTYVRAGKMPREEIIGHDEEPLTFENVTAAFERSDPPLVEAEQATREER
jgi:putative membrane protein